MHEVEALERRGWEALSGLDGAAFYDEWMAEDGLMVFPDMVLDKGQALAAIADADPWSSHQLSDVRVIEASPEVAIVVYRATASQAGAAEYRALMSSTYVRRDQRWLLILHQQTP